MSDKKPILLMVVLSVCAALIILSRINLFHIPQFEVLVPFNKELFLLINSFHNGAMDIFFLNFLNGAFTSFVEMGTGWLGVPIAIYIFIKYRHYFLPLVISFLLQTIIVHSLKNIFSQHRPPAAINPNEFHCFFENTGNNSFPSGDVGFAFSVAAVVWFAVYKNKPLLVLYIIYPIIIIWQRIYIGVHFPLDVLTGAVIGVLCAVISLKISPSIEFLYEQLKLKINRKGHNSDYEI